MKGITLCADCAYYSMKKHRCIRGATDDSDPRASFFVDCPLDDVAPVVLCKECKHYVWDEWDNCHCCVKLSGYVKNDFWCAYGERKNND